MDLNNAFCLSIELMCEHGLIASGWRFSFDNAKRRFGNCHFGLKRISLSKHLVSLNTESVVKNTILHEIAHALVGIKHNHDNVWKVKAIEIGCTGDRCYSSTNTVTPEPKYLLICPNGHTFERYKKSKDNFRQSCAKCCPKFNDKYLLTHQPNPKH